MNDLKEEEKTMKKFKIFQSRRKSCCSLMWNFRILQTNIPQQVTHSLRDAPENKNLSTQEGSLKKQLEFFSQKIDDFF